MIRATVVEGIGKRWLELEKYVYTRDEWHWRSVGRLGFGELPNEEESLSEEFTLLYELLNEWLDAEDRDRGTYWLHI